MLMQTISYLVHNDAPAHLIQVPSTRFKGGIPTLFTVDREGDLLKMIPLCILATQEMWRGTSPDPKFPMQIPIPPKSDAREVHDSAGKPEANLKLVLPGDPGFDAAKRVAGEK